jgi:hypothetical protein
MTLRATRQIRPNDRRGLDYQPVIGSRGVGFSLGQPREQAAPRLRAVRGRAWANRDKRGKEGG